MKTPFKKVARVTKEPGKPPKVEIEKDLSQDEENKTLHHILKKYDKGAAK